MHKGTQGTLFTILLAASLLIGPACLAYTRTPSGTTAAAPIFKVNITTADCIANGVNCSPSTSIYLKCKETYPGGDQWITCTSPDHLIGSSHDFIISATSTNWYNPNIPITFTKIRLWNQYFDQSGDLDTGLFSITNYPPPPPPPPPTSADQASAVVTSLWVTGWENFVNVILRVFGILIIVALIFWALRYLLRLFKH